MKKTVKIIGNCLLGIIIVFLSFIIIFNFFSKNDIGKIGKYSFFDVNGDSMYPRIKNGDFISINTGKKDKYESGDIVAFISVLNNQKIIITHKVEKVIYENDTYKYITKGINNINDDERVITNKDIIGEYTNFRIPLLGYVIRFSRTKVGYLLLVLMPLGTVLFWASYELLDEISKCKKKEEF